MSNSKSNPNIPEDRIITVWGCSNVFALKAMNNQERRSTMHARLTSVFPQNTNFYEQEIKEVLVSIMDRNDFKTQKAFVELTTKGRANEIMSKYWNPNNDVSRSQIGISLRNYTKHADEEEYLGARIRNTKRPRDDTSPEDTVSEEEMLRRISDEKQRDNIIVVKNYPRIIEIRKAGRDEKKKMICDDLREFNDTDFAINTDQIAAVFPSHIPENNKQMRQNGKGTLKILFRHKVSGFYLRKFNEKYHNKQAPFGQIVEYRTRVEMKQSNNQNSEQDCQANESIHQNRRVASSSSSSSPGPEKRFKSKHEKWQEKAIADSINAKLNHHKTIEDYIRKNIFEMIVFALKYKVDDNQLTLRNWMIDNLQTSGKRIIILIHNNKNFGFEWNPYDLIIKPLWQRKWEYVLGLENDDMREEIKDTETTIKVVKVIYNIIRDIDDRQIKSNATVTEQAFYITEILTPSISPIIYGHYLRIMDNPRLNIENISKKELNEVCLEIDTQATVRSWEHEEMTHDVENIKSINIPGLYGITLDKNLCKSVKMWIIRGFELAKSTSLKLTDDNNNHLSQGLVRNEDKLFLDATGEVIHPEKVDDDNLTIFKATYSLGCLVLHGNVERNVYIFNKNGSDHPDGPDYDIHPRNLYFGQLNRYIQIFMDDPYEILRRREAGLSDPEDEEDENVGDDEDDDTPTEEVSEDEMSELNVSIFQSGNYNYTYKMSTDDRIDDSRSESDTENTIEMTQPLRKLRKSKRARLANKKKENEVIENEGITVIGCHKNKVTEKYLVPSSKYVTCEYCQEYFKDQPSLGRHWQKCEAWKRKLKSYEALEKDGPGAKHTQTRVELKAKNDMIKIQELCKTIEDMVFEEKSCQSKRCTLKARHINLLETTLKLNQEFRQVLAEKNEVLHHKNLVIRQYQIQKNKDDREIILHRIRLIEGLEKVLKIERILNEHDVRFIRKDTSKCASKREIKALIKEGHSTCDMWRTCSNCERTLKEEEPFELHTGLLFCNHDQTTNLTVKKYLTSEKFIKMYNAGLRLTRTLDILDESVKKHYFKK